MRHWIALEGVSSESRSAELARVKIARGTVDNVGVVVEAWCWRFVICVPRPQAAAQSQTELRDLGSLSVHPVVSHTPRRVPYWATFGRRSSTSYRTWEGMRGAHGWCRACVVGACLCVYVCGG